MSQNEMTRQSSFDAPPAGGPGTGTRVDAPHVRADEIVSPEVPSSPDAAERQLAELPPDVAQQQLRQQASQLAGHLQRQATSVDHRESELNARLAAVENQVRSAQLWLTEQHQELEARGAELDRRERELDQREARLESDAAPPGRTSRVDQARLDEREAELAHRRKELDAVSARLSDRLDAAHQVEDARRTLRGIDGRTKELDRAEAMLTTAQTEFDNQRKLLADERKQFAEETEAERRCTIERNEQLASQHERAETELKRQADELASRQAALEQMRADMSRSQQEVLEIRLATEELWARLCGSMAPAALTRSLAQTRVQLAEQQHLVRTELAQQKLEIQTLSAQLAEQHRKLATRREDLQAWAEKRQREFEKQAERLAEQERRLTDEQAELARKRQDWDSERSQLNQEIRRLLRQQGRATTTAA